MRFLTAVDLVNQLEAEARAGKAGKLPDQLVRVDLVIIDEAHRLGGSTDQVARYKLGRALAEAAPYFLLLSATPHQGKTDAFHRLVSLLDQQAFLRECAGALPARSHMLVVEYDTDMANPWVPYPISQKTLERLLMQEGYGPTTFLGSRPSRYRRAEIYCVMATSS